MTEKFKLRLIVFVILLALTTSAIFVNSSRKLRPQLKELKDQKKGIIDSLNQSEKVSDSLSNMLILKDEEIDAIINSYEGRTPDIKYIKRKYNEDIQIIDDFSDADDRILALSAELSYKDTLPRGYDNWYNSRTDGHLVKEISP